jgi:antitoxin Phd
MPNCGCDYAVSAICDYVYAQIARRGMNKLTLRAAKTSLSAIVRAAERGEPTTITKHGKPAAVVVPLVHAERIYPAIHPSFADLLMSIPEDLETERDRTPLRNVDL